MLPEDKLDLILRRHEELSHRMMEGVSGQEFAKVSRELADLDGAAEAIRNWQQARRDLAEAKVMLADASLDRE